MKMFNIVTLSFAAALFACDAEEATEPTPDRRVDELAPDDIQRLCDASLEQVRSIGLEQYVCTGLAASLAPDEARCKAIRDDCLADPPEAPAPSIDSCVAELTEKSKACAAPVKLLETCRADLFKASKAALDSLCANAPVDLEDAPDTPQPESCRELAEQCPDML